MLTQIVFIMALFLISQQGVNIRLVLVLVALSALSLDLAVALGKVFVTQDMCPDKWDTDVLILGAGMAGLSAAKAFSDNGTKQFLIFEGEDHIGGRVRSIVLEKSETRIELGANWIEEIDPQQPSTHPLWNIVEKCGGVEGFWQKDPSENASLRVYGSDGTNLTKSPEFHNRLFEWQRIFNKVIDLAEYRISKNLSDISVRQALKMKGWFPNSPLDNLIEWIGYDWEFENPPDNGSLFAVIETPFGNKSEGILWKYFVNDQKFGYKKVLDCLVEDVLSENDKRVHLKSTVSSIKWGDNCVCITTDDDNTSEQQYCAPYAVITFSIGVLKSNNVQFVPPLPQTKIDLLNKISNSLYLKVFLEFENTFWETDVDYILHVDPVRGNFFHFQSLARYPATHPSVLIVTVTGEKARMVYTQSRDETVADIMQILSKIYVQKNVTNPLNMVIPDWGISPYYRGMYSFLKVDSDQEQVAKPIGKLYFAGEAFSVCCNGFVHGAYFSGIDTAKLILDDKAKQAIKIN